LVQAGPAANRWLNADVRFGIGGPDGADIGWCRSFSASGDRFVRRGGAALEAAKLEVARAVIELAASR
jgi:hypothetical protein